ncbi:MAG: adenylate/guanylate cyclase domain-containing protein, partial [Spirochaetota bacterium]
MNKLRHFLKRMPGSDEFEKAYPETYSGELKRQCNKIILPAAVIAFFDWMGYIPVDMALNPDKPIIVFFRVGLSVVSLLILLILLFRKKTENGMILVGVMCMYLLYATAILTGVAIAKPVYFGGFLFVLMLPILAPLPRYVTWAITWSAAAIFVTVALFNGMELSSYEARYRMNDLIGVLVVVTIFTYFLDKSRLRSWMKSKKIESQREELYQDKNRIDQLLQNILPKVVVEELKLTGSVKPVHFNSVTVVFTDFVGFTSIVEKLAPEQLIRELDQCFSFFDNVMEKYNLEKLKTIGDGYMYAGGVPSKCGCDHVNAVLAALEILKFMDCVNESKRRRGEDFWEIRIGINTGPLMAGVVGEKKFIYDVWGDSVNIASRMESHGGIGRVNISENTNEMIKDFFKTQHRGKVTAKNKGLV